MRISKILVAVDDDKISGDRLVEFLSQLQWTPGTTVKVVHAIEPIEAMTTWPSEQRRKEAVELIGWMAQRIRERVPEVDIETHFVEGYAKEVIIDIAKSWGADLIIVGSRGKRGIGGVLIGSVSKAVALNAPCSVVVVREAQTRKGKPGSGAAGDKVTAGKAQYRLQERSP